MFSLEIDGLTKRFGGVTAVNNVNFSISQDSEEGQIVGIIGPNGAGKTTMLSMINGFLKPTEGKIILNKRPIQNLRPDLICKFHGVARTFQVNKLLASLTVLENVMTGAHIRFKSNVFTTVLGLKKSSKEESETREIAIDLLKQLQLEMVMYRKASELSYGSRRIIELAKAIMSRPVLLLADEPFAGLNTGEKAKLVEVFQWVKSQGVVVFLVEHDIRTLVSLCSRMIVLNNGKKLTEGLPDVVINDPAVKEAYLGKKGLGHAQNR